MKKTLRIIILLALVVTTYRVFDRQNRLVEIWQDRGERIEIFGSDMSRRGHIEKGVNRWSRFDRGMRLEATIEREGKGEITLDRIER